MKSVSENETSSSKSSGNLRIDFYESGVGDTIIVTFPSGGIALIDAHPTQQGNRPRIQELVAGKTIHFVCLTHPHADHGIDLIPVLEGHSDPGEFWHTIYDVPALMYGIEQTPNFPSPVREFASKMNQDWGEFLCDLLAAVAKRDLPRHLLRSDLQASVIDGVEVHCLGPDESVQNKFFDAYKRKLSNPDTEVPDPNLLSAILALKFGQSLVLLGADALKRNWESAVKLHQKLGLPKARVLKIPHHGARNSLNLQKKAVSYLDICSVSPRANSVLFAGDAKHPDADVYTKLSERTEVFCLSNGKLAKQVDSNPLNIRLLGARIARPAPVCNPTISFTLDTNGDVVVLAGASCARCPIAQTGAN